MEKAIFRLVQTKICPTKYKNFLFRHHQFLDIELLTIG